jgi:hypothetical protein
VRDMTWRQRRGGSVKQPSAARKHGARQPHPTTSSMVQRYQSVAAAAAWEGKWATGGWRIVDTSAQRASPARASRVVGEAGRVPDAAKRPKKPDATGVPSNPECHNSRIAALRRRLEVIARRRGAACDERRHHRHAR